MVAHIASLLGLMIHFMEQPRTPSTASGRQPWRPYLQLRSQGRIKEKRMHKEEALAQASLKLHGPILSDYHRRKTRRLLYEFCSWLDSQIHMPAVITAPFKGYQRITLFGAVTFGVDTEKQHISHGCLIDGKYRASGETFEVGQPLPSYKFLLPILENRQLTTKDHPDLCFDEPQHDLWLEYWLARKCFSLLKKQLSFQEFRRATLPGLFEIPADIRSIALASRPRPCGLALDSNTLNRVWRNQNAFRQCARENPQLLPVLNVFADYLNLSRQSAGVDPIKSLKVHLKDSGISEAGWRYIVKHGARTFKTAWWLAEEQEPISVFMGVFKMLEDAGLPPPPPPYVLKTLLTAYNRTIRGRLDIETDFHGAIDARFLRRAFHQADIERNTKNIESFSEDMMGVLWWSEQTHGTLPDNLVRQDWCNLVSRWRRDAHVYLQLDAHKGIRWNTSHGELYVGGYSVSPVCSASDLILMGQKLRNCLGAYLDDCVNGRKEIYALKLACSEKLVGCVGLNVSEESQVSIFDVRGFANSRASAAMRKVALTLCQQISDIQQQTKAGMKPNESR